MGGIFNIDGPLMRTLTKVADLMILNVLAMICSIPIFTMGASLTALHYMSLKIVRGEEGYIIRGFFKSFKENFKQATLIWLMVFAFLFVLVADILAMTKLGVEVHVVLKVLIGIVAAIGIFTSLYVFAVQAKFENTIRQTIKNAFLMSLMQFPKTLLMVILYVLPYFIGYIFPQIIPIVFLLCLSGPIFCSALLYNKFFKKLEDRVLYGEEGENAQPDDDVIFKDEPDISLEEVQKTPEE